VKVLDTALSLPPWPTRPRPSPGDSVAIPSRSMQVLGRAKVGRTPVSTYRLQLQPGFGFAAPPPPRTTWLTWA